MKEERAIIAIISVFPHSAGHFDFEKYAKQKRFLSKYQYYIKIKKKYALPVVCYLLY
jgi:hypothetical protein